MSRPPLFVNDYIAVLPGVRTLWHDLIQWFGLEPISEMPYGVLADTVERVVAKTGPPPYLIRNGSYFRHLNINCPQLSFYQDQCEWDSPLRNQQLTVMQQTFPVFCSNYMEARYPEILSRPHAVCPTGSDASFWTPGEGDPRVLPDSICFCGPPIDVKGWPRLRELINTTPFNYCIITKDATTEFDGHPRVRVFTRTQREETRALMRACVMGLCLSVTEAGHVSGQEMGLVGLPLVATPVAVYWGRKAGAWGKTVEWGLDFVETLRSFMDIKTHFDPRFYWMEAGFDLPAAKQRWLQAIERAVHEWESR